MPIDQFRRFRLPPVRSSRPRDKNQKPRAERGYDDDWLRLQGQFIHRNPFCRFCEQSGRTRPASTVDHIIPIEEAPELRLVWSNLQSLCDRHHFGTKARLERLARETGDVMVLVAWCANIGDREAALRTR